MEITTRPSNELVTDSDVAALLRLSDDEVCDDDEAVAVPVADADVDEFVCGLFQCARMISDARSASP